MTVEVIARKEDASSVNQPQQENLQVEFRVRYINLYNISYFEPAEQGSDQTILHTIDGHVFLVDEPTQQLNHRVHDPLKRLGIYN